MDAINWCHIFTGVVAQGRRALQWGLPEPWVHAELFAALSSVASQAEWLPQEVPYVTSYPVFIPGAARSTWRESGAIKWVDLCGHSRTGNIWYWIELKVRHARDGDHLYTGAASAMDAFRKDVVSLMGFDVPRTSDVWKQPDRFTKAYWFESVLGPHREQITPGTHRFVAAFLQLGAPITVGSLFAKDPVLRDIGRWLAWCQRRLGVTPSGVPFPIEINSHDLPGPHGLLICEWSRASTLGPPNQALHPTAAGATTSGRG